MKVMNTERKRKSEKLSPREFKALQKFIGGFDTVVEAAEEIGIHRNVLDLVKIKGSGSPETIHAIREKLIA
jgi:hypothetical protein